ncbi:hypothetical protein [Actinomycetospora atypica]|uniref:DUF1330 domain-containing protein n=1 Tax=Actinomycetospora atypica TaxID=1290095 RepID=A0ABV9YNW6_9PSEU
MPSTHLDQARLQAVDAPAEGPVVMLNLVRFRDEADYGPDSDQVPCSGRTAYFERYVPAFRKVAPEYGGTRPVYLGRAHELLVGAEGEKWDVVALVQYPDLAALKGILGDERYLRDAAPHRVAGVADWRFLVTSAVA